MILWDTPMKIILPDCIMKHFHQNTLTQHCTRLSISIVLAWRSLLTSVITAHVPGYRWTAYITNMTNLRWQRSIHANLLPGLGQEGRDDLSLQGQLFPCTYPLINVPDDF